MNKEMKEESSEGCRGFNSGTISNTSKGHFMEPRTKHILAPFRKVLFLC